MGALDNLKQDIAEMLTLCGTYMRFFAIVGGVALLGFLKPGDTDPGLGTAAAMLLGICWIGLHFVARWWSQSPAAAARQRRLAHLATLTILVSVVAFAVALREALIGGFTTDIDTGGRHVRGAWLVWLAPTLAFLFSAASAWAAHNLTRDSRQILLFLHGKQE